MKSKFITPLLAVLVLALSSCAKIYYSPDAKVKAEKHEIIAIAPPRVSIAAQKKVDPEAIKEQQKRESANFQKEMHSWLLKRQMQQKVKVNILDVETTNALLTKAGYFDGTALTPAEICKVLGVDGLITSNYSLSKPMSEGAAVAVGLLVGAWGATNNTTITLEIHDMDSRTMLWSYNHKASGSVGSSPSQLVDNLMRHASKKMPYKS